MSTDPVTWTTSGLSLAEILAIKTIAREYPDGACAAFVRKMDAGQIRRAGYETNWRMARSLFPGDES